MDLKTEESKKNAADYFKRQTVIASFGSQKQSLLGERSCLIVGAGGLGCPAGLYLAVSGVGHIGICDYDVVEYSNLSRQILYGIGDCGKKKAQQACDKLAQHNPHSRYTPHSSLLNEENLDRILAPYDIILDCSDNFHTQYLVHDACLSMKKDLVQADIFQKHGQTLGLAFSQYPIFRSFQTNPAQPPSRGQSGEQIRIVCMRCLRSEEPPAGCVSSCADGGILSIVAGAVGLQQASLALQFLQQNYHLAGITRLFHFESQVWDAIPLPVVSCSYCQGSRLDPIPTQAMQIDHIPESAADSWVVLDVRNEHDQQLQPLHRKYPIYEVKDSERQAWATFSKVLLQSVQKKDVHYLLVCYRGIRSLDLARDLCLQGIQAHSLVKGYSLFMQFES